MTSNAGTAELNLKGKVGFKDENKKVDFVNDNIIKNALTKYFRIEFLNRIDEQIIFKTLSLEDVKKIVKIKLENINEVLIPKRINLTFTDDLIDFVAEISYDDKYGARPILRTISKEIQTPFSQKILKKEIVDGVSVQIGYDKEKKEVTFEKIKKEEVKVVPVKKETSKKTKK
jgi:ATP-dependent Clp protease ATP-binding subunit ClpC